MSGPIRVWVWIIGCQSSSIRDEDRVIFLPGGFEAEIVVNPAIAEDCVGSEGRLLEVACGGRIKLLRMKLQFHRRQDRGKGGRCAYRDCQLQGGILDESHAIVAHVGLAESPKHLWSGRS